MPTASFGEDIKFYVDSLDITPVKTLIEGTTGMRFSTGKGTGRVVTKTGTYSYITDAGPSLSFQMVLERPVGAGQALLKAVAAAEQPHKVYIEGSKTGDETFEFDALIVITERDFPEEGVTMLSIEVSGSGDITEDVVA